MIIIEEGALMPPLKDNTIYMIGNDIKRDK